MRGVPRLVCWCCAICVLAAGGCRGGATRPDPEVMSDRSASAAQRIRAIETVPLDAEDTDAGLARLHVLVWTDGHPDAVRLAAADRLRGHDASAFWSAAERWLDEVDDAEVFDGLIDRAALDGSGGLIPVVLRRWARFPARADEAAGPHYRALQRLLPGREPEDELRELVQTHSQRHVAANAWVGLCRLVDPAALRRELAGWPPGGLLTADLREALPVLDRLPRNAEGLKWLAALREDPERWAAIVGSRTRGDAADLDGVELRHLAVCLHADAAYLRGGRAALHRSLSQRLEPGSRVPRAIDRAAEQDQDAVLESLSPADTAVVLSVLDVLQSRGVLAELFRQADSDHRDTQTEHGGVLTWGPQGRPVALDFPSHHNASDRKFYSSPAMVEAVYTGLAHYHFHAQAYANADYAGPGRGDLDFAEALGANALTFTFVNRDTLNADLTLPAPSGTVVLDLGVIQRPGSPRSNVTRN